MSESFQLKRICLDVEFQIITGISQQNIHLQLSIHQTVYEGFWVRLDD